MYDYTLHTCNHPYIGSSGMADATFFYCYLCRDGCMCETYSHTLWFLFMHLIVSQ